VQDNKKQLHYIYLGTQILNILDLILHKTCALSEDHSNIPIKELLTLLKERENLIKKLNPYRKELNAYTKENTSVPKEIEQILLKIKQRLSEINECDEKILNTLKAKKKKIVKEISELADNNMRRKFFDRTKGARSKFIDIKQR